MNPDISNSQLTNWAYEMRRAYRDGTLRPVWKDVLDATPGWRWEAIPRLSAKDWVPLAESLAQEHDGAIPSSTWLKRNGYGFLLLHLHQHPELFAHLKRNSDAKSPQEWVPIAEERARNNGGLLECSHWLIQNGLGGLAQSIRIHPEFFRHIRQEMKGGNYRSIDDWVAFAEKLAQEKGTLDSPAQLVKNHMAQLAKIMREHPERFAHIAQERHASRHRPLEEWVAIAEERARLNGGELEYPTWLRKHDLNGLANAIGKFPQAFAHIPQSKPIKTNAEWVKYAEDLARDNNGSLKSAAWIKENHRGLARVMQKFPALFRHIPQTRIFYRRRPAEWVAIAENLAAENGGILQPRGWLQRNGYGALARLATQKPELFAHISQTEFSRRTPHEWVAIAEELARANGGVLGCYKTLTAQGMNALHQQIRHHPELFAHIPRERVRVTRRSARKVSI